MPPQGPCPAVRGHSDTAGARPCATGTLRSGPASGDSPEVRPELPGRLRRLRAAPTRCPRPHGVKPHVSPYSSSGDKVAACGCGGWWHHGRSARCSRPGPGGTAGSPPGEKSSFSGFLLTSVLFSSAGKDPRAPRALEVAQGAPRNPQSPQKLRHSRRGTPRELPRSRRVFQPLLTLRAPRDDTRGRAGWASAPPPPSSPPHPPCRRRCGRRAPPWAAPAGRCRPSAR